MNAESKGYTIYNLKTGQAVAQLGLDGTIQEDGDPLAVAEQNSKMILFQQTSTLPPVLEWSPYSPETWTTKEVVKR